MIISFNLFSMQVHISSVINQIKTHNMLTRLVSLDANCYPLSSVTRFQKLHSTDNKMTDILVHAEKDA